MFAHYDNLVAGRLLFFLLFICLIQPLFANVVDPLSYPELYDQQFVQVRGFLYQSESNEIILSNQIGLKSCCIGSQAKLGQQIVVYSSQKLEPRNTAITLVGLFKIENKLDSQGDLIKYFVLEEAIEINNHTFSPLFIGILVVFILTVLLYVIARIRRKRLAIYMVNDVG